MKRIFLLLGILMSLCELSFAQATWIWYPGDFEIWLSNNMQNRRTDRGMFYPVFWKVDSHYPLVNFYNEFTLTQAEEINIYAEGTYNVKLDGQFIEGVPKQLTIPAGKHKINVKVFNQASVPAIFISGKTIVSDASWKATFEDKEWVDETGNASDISATKWLDAGRWNFNDSSRPPSVFKLPVVAQYTVAKQGSLVDFGKETFGFIKLHGIRGRGNVTLYYGESKEEALSEKGAITLDRLTFQQQDKRDSVLSSSRAFRYVNVVTDGTIQTDSISMLYEYSDLKMKGDFKCSDDEINKIYDIATYTFHLNTREFFIDGIKRDRWVWSGDAYQSYLMNYYLFFDNETVSRTMLALRGKDPVTSHVNTIMDYSFYWFLGIYDYYLYTGDQHFIKQFYPRMQGLMDFCLGRRNKDGLMEGMPGDWIFIDWADKLSKEGAVSFEQLLLCRSLETMALCADIADRKADAAKYKQYAAELRTKLFTLYWNETKQALVHSRINEKQTDNVTRYANMFAIFFDYFSPEQKEAVKKSVLLNDSIQKIITPYMRFYELEALCAIGEQSYVLKEMKDYWGGMLKLGATSFWEEYRPDLKGAAHYAMYGRDFGKSLCHAWGASPIYLLGKYYLGVKPTAPGYQAYTVQPVLGGLKWMNGHVPTPDGNIAVQCSMKEISINTAAGVGTLRFQSKTKPVCKGEVIENKNGWYELTMQPHKNYTVTYAAK
jgi:hypothetical protein